MAADASVGLEKVIGSLPGAGGADAEVAPPGGDNDISTLFAGPMDVLVTAGAQIARFLVVAGLLQILREGQMPTFSRCIKRRRGQSAPAPPRGRPRGDLRLLFLCN